MADSKLTGKLENRADTAGQLRKRLDCVNLGEQIFKKCDITIKTTEFWNELGQGEHKKWFVCLNNREK